MVNLAKIVKKVLKLFNRTKLGRRRRTRSRGLLGNPSFYFVSISLILFWGISSSCGDFAGAGTKSAFFSSFAAEANSIGADSLFSSKDSAIALETPDLKIIQNNTIAGISTPSVVSGKVLGDVFGGTAIAQNVKKEVVDYTVEAGDTLQSIADSYGLSVNTLIWANDLTSSSVIKVGQAIAILPTDGISHAVKSGDTISGIAQTYKAKTSDIVSFNNLSSQDDIFIGDILIVPGGTKPKASAPSVSSTAPLADNFFIFPTQGRISQGLHYYNAIDVANKCGTPIYAAASGVVQRAVGNGGWNSGMGNHITILHSNGMVTYYGHLMTLLVKPGDTVYRGQNIALMGGQPGMAGAGKSTGCHVHFQVIGGKNPLSAYKLGSTISYK